MLVEITVNTMNSGRFQICAIRQSQNPHTVRSYVTREETEAVLAAIGIREFTMLETLDLLADIGPNQPMSFGLMDLDEGVLRKNGFLV